MSTMSQNNIPQGFYVFQSALGAPLEFHPALGTLELDDMMDAYLPSTASIQDKRAAISMDFFEHLSLTGETIKFYPTPAFSFASSTSSPASLQDSGYGSSFSVSPVAPTWNWGQAASVPAASSRPSGAQSRRQHAPARHSPLAPTRQHSTDFSHLPGMKILTKDGRDVTHATSRGCKTKEQRDHAHLMRIIKACDSCRRKKVRCDPSHKARDSARPRKEARVALQSTPANTRSLPIPQDWAQPAFFPETPYIPELETLDPAANVLEWNDLVQLDQGLSDLAVPVEDYEWPVDSNGFFSPTPAASSTTPISQPFTPGSQQSASPQPGHCSALTSLEGLESPPPSLPYLEENSGPPHKYVDFNLYSPASSFCDDEPIFAGDLSANHELCLAEQVQRGRGEAAVENESPGSLELYDVISTSRVGEARDTGGMDNHEHVQSMLSSTKSPTLARSTSTIQPTAAVQPVSSAEATILQQAAANVKSQLQSCSGVAFVKIRSPMTDSTDSPRTMASPAPRQQLEDAYTIDDAQRSDATTSTIRTQIAEIHNATSEQSGSSSNVQFAEPTQDLASTSSQTGRTSTMDSRSEMTLHPTIHDGSILLPTSASSVKTACGGNKPSGGILRYVSANSDASQLLETTVNSGLDMLGCVQLLAVLGLTRRRPAKLVNSVSEWSLFGILVFSIVGAMAIVALANGVKALSQGSDTGFKDSLFGVVLCSVAYSTSRRSPKSLNEGVGMRRGSQTLTRNILGEGTATFRGGVCKIGRRFA